MRRLTTFWLAMMGAAALTACAGAHIPPAPLRAAAGVTTRGSDIAAALAPALVISRRLVRPPTQGVTNVALAR